MSRRPNKSALCLTALMMMVLVQLPSSAHAQDELRAPNPDETLAGKEAFLHADPSFNAVFIGSSRVQTQFVPEVFDEIVAARGVDMRSFNLGAAGMTAAEVESVARRVIAEDTDNSLKWIFVYPEVIAPQISVEDLESTRNLAWHEPTPSLTSLRVLAEQVEPSERTSEWAQLHTTALILNATQLATARDGLISVRVGRRAEQIAPIALVGPANDGFVALDWLAAEFPNPGLDRRISEFQGAQDAWLRDIDALRNTYAGALQPATPTESDYLGRFVELSETTGRIVVIVGPPSATPRTWLQWAGDNGLYPYVFDYNDPNLYPELFNPGLWFDRAHLATDGARLFTALFAEDFASSAELMSG